jgi:septal ring factor EnvC (AmiA/AmiB activator)
MLLETQNTATGLNPYSVIALVFSGLLGSGALAWFIRSGTDMKMASKDATEARKKADEAHTKASVLESRVNQQDTIISEIRSRMSKLDKVDEMVAAVEFIKNAFQQHLVPRQEHERQWRADEERFERLERDILALKRSDAAKPCAHLLPPP